MTDYQALLGRYQAKLAEQRLLMTQWVQQTVSQYNALPEEVRSRLPALEGSTAEELVPALYAETITAATEAEYKAQIGKLQQFVTECNKLLTEYNNSESVRCLL